VPLNFDVFVIAVIPEIVQTSLEFGAKTDTGSTVESAGRTVIVPRASEARVYVPRLFAVVVASDVPVPLLACQPVAVEEPVLRLSCAKTRVEVAAGDVRMHGVFVAAEALDNAACCFHDVVSPHRR
jgi:hypothetical protein